MIAYYEDWAKALTAEFTHPTSSDMQARTMTVYSCGGNGETRQPLLVIPSPQNAVYRAEVICADCGRKLLIEL